jgi:hypothetical protein
LTDSNLGGVPWSSAPIRDIFSRAAVNFPNKTRSSTNAASGPSMEAVLGAVFGTLVLVSIGLGVLLWVLHKRKNRHLEEVIPRPEVNGIMMKSRKEGDFKFRLAK